MICCSDFMKLRLWLGFGTPAVADVIKRFPDFPAPVAELRSGPVFFDSQVKAWLAKRNGADLSNLSGFYERMALKCGHAMELTEKVKETIAKLTDERTSIRSPRVLLGKI